MTPREPDRFDAQARELLDIINDGPNDRLGNIAAALRAAESSALNAVRQYVEARPECSQLAMLRLLDDLIPPAAAPAGDRGPVAIQEINAWVDTALRGADAPAPSAITYVNAEQWAAAGQPPLDDKKAREPGCQCHQEEGDSPCPVHGDDAPAAETGKAPCEVKHCPWPAGHGAIHGYAPAIPAAAETGKARCQCTIGSVATSCVYAAPDCVCECACHAAAAETGKGRGADKIGYCKTCGLDASHGVCNDPRDVRIAELEGALAAAHVQGDAPGDWACAECHPNSELITKGFRCWWHMGQSIERAKLAARAAPPEREGK